jgi:RNA polymerase sigma-70 factor, ECF subfamily
MSKNIPRSPENGNEDDARPDGDSSAADYVRKLEKELRILAARHLRHERANHTLQPTALVHEAYLKLRDTPGFESPDHFLAAAAVAMHRVLVDHARRRRAAKRGGGEAPLNIVDEVGISDTPAIDVAALHEAMAKLNARDQQQASVVELRVFGGLGIQAIALRLGVSHGTVKNDWRVAKAFLKRELAGETAA